MINFKIWLTALLVTSGVWVAFESGAPATSLGTGTAGNISITQNGTVITDSTTNPVISRNNNNTFVNSTNSNSTGGNIVVIAGDLILVRKVPEPSVIVGILAVGGAAVSRLKRKRK